MSESTSGRLNWLAGGGAMSAVIASFDWSQSPLGPIEQWPQSLRTTVSLCLASNFPINIIWGEGHTQLYNDGYRVVCGAAHPRALGEDYRVTWASAWPAIGEPFRHALMGETTFLENQRMFLERNGYLEETFFTFSLSPIREESGEVVGLFHPVTETTTAMLSERRTRLLRAIADEPGRAAAFDAACELLLDTVAGDPFDIPFALLYVTAPDGRQATLRGARGTPAGGALAPISIALAEAATWPLAPSITDRVLRVVDVQARFGAVACVPYPEPVATAFVVPVRVAGFDGPIGYLVVGASPRLPHGDPYVGFIEMLGAATSAALGNARGFEAERQRAEALAELDRAKTLFFNNVSHEFRTPLTLILGPVEDALSAPKRALAGEELEAVHRSALRLVRLVNSLLDFARLEGGRHKASLAPIDLATLTSDLASSFRSLVERAGLTLTVDCPPLPEQVYVDAEQWEKIVLNLVSNAFKFTLSGDIRVALRWAGDRVELSVRDTGVGIPARELPHIFERFHRVEGAKGRSFEGTGIGLSLVTELAKLHGGAVSVESIEGSGTTFRVAIPTGSAHLPKERLAVEVESVSAGARPTTYLLEAAQWLGGETVFSAAMTAAASEAASLPSAAGNERDADARSGRPTVLVVDDNADMRAYLVRLLSTHWQVASARDGEEGLARVRHAAPDMVLSDVMMPNVDGVSMLRALRSDPRTKEIPVVLLSARAGEEALVEGLETGADDYLFKPFSARELLARVKTHLEMARLRREWAMEREEAARVSAAKTNFLRLVSHEFRTPLAALRLQLTRFARARGDLKLTEAQRELFARMTTTVTRLTELVESLLAYARVESGRWSLQLETFDAVQAARDVVDELRPQTRNKALVLAVHPEGSPPLAIVSDARLVKLVLVNLLGNAVKFTDAGRVEVYVERSEAHVQYVVTDTGPGIPEADRDRIFMPFEQVTPVDSKHVQGFGLGLALVREMLVVLGGTIELRSEVTVGSTFRVTLPVSARVGADGRESGVLAPRKET